MRNLRPTLFRDFNEGLRAVALEMITAIHLQDAFLRLVRLFSWFTCACSSPGNGREIACCQSWLFIEATKTIKELTILSNAASKSPEVGSGAGTGAKASFAAASVGEALRFKRCCGNEGIISGSQAVGQ